MLHTIAWYEVIFFLTSFISSILNFIVFLDAGFIWITNWAKRDNRIRARRIAEIGLIYSVTLFFLTTVNTILGIISFFAPNREDLTPFETSFVLILTGFSVFTALGSLRIHFLLKRIFA